MTLPDAVALLVLGGTVVVVVEGFRALRSLRAALDAYAARRRER